MGNGFVSAERLMRALSNEEFEPYLQPIVSASDLTVSGAELLVRWHIPTGEIIPPAYFINLVESAGLLLPLTEKMLSRAVGGLSEIKTMLPRGFRLAVNVTPALLADDAFTQMCLALTGLDNVHLVLELTEQQPFNVGKHLEQMLNRLSDAGVKFALDDFGTGCSVLAYLKHFPVSYIKMDKSFTQDILRERTSRHIVECVVGLAEKQGIDTVAEGIETKMQVNYFSSLGVNYLQGFYFGRPERLRSFCCKYSQNHMSLTMNSQN
ncbi:TPA: EAL domain-containing protein [Escherichia coli]|nr:EAL domain-containing protein [Escherichia coli]HAW0423205.1 EAL domain-containing protein [Escherichia coli]